MTNEESDLFDGLYLSLRLPIAGWHREYLAQGHTALAESKRGESLSAYISGHTSQACNHALLTGGNKVCLIVDQ